MSEESKARFDFKKQVEALKKYRGRGTELISVYITPGYQISDIVAKLRDEYGQASNIKSKSTQKNVQAALERIMAFLKNFRTPPANGMAVFAGNVSQVEGKTDYELFSIEPPMPLAVQFYRCESVFVTEPLEELIDVGGQYGLVVMDGKEATVAVLKGKQIRVVKRMESTAHQKVHKGGQCIHENELVCFSDGSVLPIRNAVEGRSLAALDFKSLKTADAACDKVTVRQSQKALLLKTRNPVSTLKVTPEHVFFTVTENGFEEKRAEDLKEGDFLLLASKLPSPAERVLTEAVAPEGTAVLSQEGRIKLVEKRKSLGELQREAAAAAGLDQASVSELERGDANFGQARLERLLGHYGFDANAFVRAYAEKWKLVCFPAEVTPELAQITGYFLGDGCFDVNRLRFYEGDLEVAKHYEAMIGAVFGASTRIKKRASGWGECFETTAYNKWLVELFAKAFPELADKQVPEKVMRSPNDVVAGFLRGLFDAEGSASSGRISLAMANEGAVKTARLLLLRFGIIASCAPKKSGKKQQYYLEVSDSASLARFASNIGFSGSRKQGGLLKIISAKCSVNRCDQAPVNGLLVKRLAREVGLKNADFKGLPSFLNGARALSRRLFAERVLPVFKKRAVLLREEGSDLAGKAEAIADVIERIACAQVIPAKLAKKEPCSVEGAFYDLSVPETRNFIANGVVVHNSANRYDRLHVEGVEFYYKRIGAAMDAFVGLKNFLGVIVGGPGPAKHDFVKMAPFNYQLKILGVVDTGYTDEFGIREVLEKSSEIISDQEAVKEKKLLDEFMKRVSTGGLSLYGLAEIQSALERGQIERLLVTEGMELWQIKQKCGNCGKERVKLQEKPGSPEPCECGGKWQVVDEHDLVNAIVGRAEEKAVPIEMISRDTPEGSQFYATFKGLGALLRYK
ncbi:hypothetical protein COX86_01410 [Candidatus Micrarchaeota archaeon CG_4_10_14_0_2_um_filter_60_11]|nr:MAG: hypothetical protein COU39_01645 [Candidatus Micrarchaeota archaeon CG10_big_fil_rev_8_21_14_0_10_60_32]PIY91816.1 MAG: hypothetical protein COY71_01120 [Candidatus Micrarchaeota archaeon CG_4_10_14_0_8_um_filter_60_7]PIZ91119.1 MAG: hypothetical protein COX86_01410 [Candidatus Micrarchaeota archaeon CG_4_10_14_0_2_um_filter_60_11]